MRNAPLPQPNVNLADDPDPAAELGQRLAASAQTTQGIITNYLFYGQRRAAEGQNGDQVSLMRARQDELLAEAQREAADRHLDEEHRKVLAHLAEGPDGTPGPEPVTDAQAVDARMAFHVVPGVADDRLGKVSDPVAWDYLAADGLAQGEASASVRWIEAHCPNAAGVAPERSTLHL